MSKPVLVIAIEDENYLLPLELGLAERLFETAQIEVISDRAYFEEFFAVPRSIDLMIVDESFYVPELSRHNIKKTFLLSEDADAWDEDEGQSKPESQPVVHIFKYLDLQVLMNCIIPAQWGGTKTQRDRTQVIVVISAQGGAGCTTVALGLGACLKQSLKRTLYINPRTYQSFSFYLENKTALSMQGCAKMRMSRAEIYADMKSELQQEGIVYLPALPSARHALAIEENAYIRLIRGAQQSGEYDAIIVDVGNELTAGMIALLDAATKVLVVTNQDRSAAFKLQVLLHNIRCSDKEKFHFVCSRYDAASDNAYVTDPLANGVKMDEYIEKVCPEQLGSVRALAKIEGLQRVAYTLM